MASQPNGCGKLGKIFGPTDPHLWQMGQDISPFCLICKKEMQFSKMFRFTEFLLWPGTVPSDLYALTYSVFLASTT